MSFVLCFEMSIQAVYMSVVGLANAANVVLNPKVPFGMFSQVLQGRTFCIAVVAQEISSFVSDMGVKTFNCCKTFLASIVRTLKRLIIVLREDVFSQVLFSGCRVVALIASEVNLSCPMNPMDVVPQIPLQLSCKVAMRALEIFAARVSGYNMIF